MPLLALPAERDARGRVHVGAAAKRSGSPPSETLRWYVDVNERRRGFCGTCGATLFWTRAGDATISVSAGALDGPTGLVTEGHIYVADAADWESV